MEKDEQINFKYKDTVFRMLFSDKEQLLSLYNALSEKHCDNIDDLTVVTLADAIYYGSQKRHRLPNWHRHPPVGTSIDLQS